jgi:SAM-dependent methyltransferase
MKQPGIPSVDIPAQTTPPTLDSDRECVAGCGQATRAWHRGLVTCTSCGLVYFPRRLTPDEIQRLYSEEYFNGAEYLDYLGDRPVHEATFRARRSRLLRWLPRGRSLFEIGCSYGFFLNLAKEYWQVAGCDLAAKPCWYATSELNVDAREGDFLEIALERGAYDAFCMWDTIEHLEDPGHYLDRISNLLLPGGILALTTGDIGSWLARWQGPRWRQIHPPTHLWYFSRSTMLRTLERFGFEIVEFRHVGVPRSLGQVVYSLTTLGQGNPSRLYRACEATGLARLRFWLNTFDLMWVVARRI